MKYETKIKFGAKLSEIYESMIQDNWELDYYDKEEVISLWKRKIPKSRTIKVGVETEEWLEFIKLYREINKNGSYDKALIAKYEKVLKENKHSDIISNLKTYKEHLILFPSKPPLQVATYLNRNRFKDDWELIKTDFSKKWIDDRLKELGVPAVSIDPIKTEIQSWEANHGAMREMTIGILDKIIGKYFKP